MVVAADELGVDSCGKSIPCVLSLLRFISVTEPPPPGLASPAVRVGPDPPWIAQAGPWARLPTGSPLVVGCASSTAYLHGVPRPADWNMLERLTASDAMAGGLEPAWLCTSERQELAEICMVPQRRAASRRGVPLDGMPRWRDARAACDRPHALDEVHPDRRKEVSFSRWRSSRGP